MHRARTIEVGMAVQAMIAPVDMPGFFGGCGGIGGIGLGCGPYADGYVGY